MRFLRHIFAFIVLFQVNTIFSQSLNVEGNVSGYSFNSKKTIFSKSKSIDLSGSLSSVDVKVYLDGKKIISKKTSSKGNFKFSLNLGKLYTVKFSKTDYESVNFKLDLTNAKNEKVINLKTLEIILNSFIKDEDLNNSDFYIGDVVYNDENFTFSPNVNDSRYTKNKKQFAPLISLIEKSLIKNEPYLFSSSAVVVNALKDTVTINPIIDSSNIVSESLLKNSFSYKDLFKSDDNSYKSIEDKELTIKNAKQQLIIDKKNAKSDIDFILIADRELLIEAAEKEVENLKEIIKQKDISIKHKNWQMILLSFVLLCVIFIGYVIWKGKKEKEKLNCELSYKNTKILDSINYAGKIQTAVLPDNNYIKSIYQIVLYYTNLKMKSVVIFIGLQN